MRYNAEQAEAHLRDYEPELQKLREDPLNSEMMDIVDHLAEKNIAAALFFIDPETGQAKSLHNVCRVINDSGGEHEEFESTSVKLMDSMNGFIKRFLTFFLHV